MTTNYPVWTIHEGTSVVCKATPAGHCGRAGEQSYPFYCDGRRRAVSGGSLPSEATIGWMKNNFRGLGSSARLSLLLRWQTTGCRRGSLPWQATIGWMKNNFNEILKKIEGMTTNYPVWTIYEGTSVVCKASPAGHCGRAGEQSFPFYYDSRRQAVSGGSLPSEAMIGWMKNNFRGQSPQASYDRVDEK